MPTLGGNGNRLPIYSLPYLCFSKDLNTNICKASSCPRLVLNTRNTKTSQAELTKAANLAGRFVLFSFATRAYFCLCMQKNSFDAFAGLCPPLIQIYMCFLSNFIGKNFGLCYLFLLVASLKSCPGKVSSPANSIQFGEVQ